MSGSSRKGRRVKANRPSTISSRLITVASTGRRMEMSEISIGWRSLRLLGRGLARALSCRIDDLRARLELDDALDDDAIAGLHALEDLDPARAARADLHRHLVDGVTGDAEQEGLLAQLLQRKFRHL